MKVKLILTGIFIVLVGLSALIWYTVYHLSQIH
jgi:hypothetical protein